MDLISQAPRLPASGETVMGCSFHMAPGGKGGNQAVQLARCGIQTRMVTRLGKDAFGQTLAEALQAHGVVTSDLQWDPARATGASCVLAAGDEYASIVAPGAASALSLTDLPDFAPAEALVVQLELDPEVSLAAARRAKSAGGEVVLNPSPVPDDVKPHVRELIGLADMLILNQAEAVALFATDDPATLAAKTRCKIVVITYGTGGARGVAAGEAVQVDAFSATQVDPVGAGDAFLGAFVAAVLNGVPMEAALTRGAAAGALAVARPGALPALPTVAEIDWLVAARD